MRRYKILDIENVSAYCPQFKVKALCLESWYPGEVNDKISRLHGHLFYQRAVRL